ncbi:MAG: Ig-like domain repeat protein [Terracidiphilus sp.]|jgi:hypothetical protein
MLRTIRFRLSGSVTSVTFLFLIAYALLASELGAQTLPQPGFVSAPSLSLGSTPYSPSGMAGLPISNSLYLAVVDSADKTIVVYLGGGVGNPTPIYETSYPLGTLSTFNLIPISVLAANIESSTGSAEFVVTYQYFNGTTTKYGIRVLQYTPSSGGGAVTQLQSPDIAPTFPPTCLVAGDFFGSANGVQDIAVAGVTAAGVRNLVMLKNSSGKLVAQTTITLTQLTNSPTAITTGKFDTTGNSELAIANSDGSVSVLLATTPGTFTKSEEFEYPTGATTSLSSIAAFGTNNGTNVDLAVAESSKNQVWVLTGEGNGSFNNPTSYPVGSTPVAILAQDATNVPLDLNGDNNDDLIVINSGSSTFSVLLGDSSGTFQFAVDYAVGMTPIAGVAGNFYGDGKISLATINQGSETISVAHGNGDGTFKASPTVTPENETTAAYQPISVASGLLVSSGTPGLVVANYCGTDHTCASTSHGTVAVYSGGNYNSPAQTYTVGIGPVAVALAPVTGSNSDILVLNHTDKTLTLLPSNGDGTFGSAITSSGLANYPIAMAEFNVGTTPAIAVLECAANPCTTSNQVHIEIVTYANASLAVRQYSSPYATSQPLDNPTSIAVGGTSAAPYIVVGSCSGTTCTPTSGPAGYVTVWTWSTTNSKFVEGTSIGVTGIPSSVALANLDASGNPYLLVAEMATNSQTGVITDTVDVFPYGGTNGTFSTTPTSYNVGANPGALVAADFNGDGYPDVAVANQKDSTVSILTGNGDGTLNLPVANESLDIPVAWPVATSPVAMAAVVDSAGVASLATVNGSVTTTPTVPTAEITLLQTGTLAAGGLTLAASQATGAPVSLKATLAPPTDPTPTGYITFEGNGTSIPSDCVDLAVSSTTTTCSIETPTSSSTVTATYSGDINYAPAASTKLTLAPTVLTAVTVTVSSSPIEPGDTVTLSTTVSSINSTDGSPSGTVTFNDASGTACTTSPVVSGTTYSCNAVFSTAGKYSVNASFTGTPATSPGTFFTSNSTTTPTSVNVAAIQTTTTLVTAAPSTSVVNQSVAFSANVAVDPSSGYTGAALPSGTVTFTSGTGQILCTIPLVAPSPAASCLGPVFTAGSNTITATYTPASGSIFASSSAIAAVNQTVTPDPTKTTSVTASPSTSVVNQLVTFTANVAVDTSNGGYTNINNSPSGPVTFSYGSSGQTLCTATLATSSPTASCQATMPVAGSYTVTANYNGDSTSSFAPSSATAAGSQIVTPDPTKTTLVTALPSTSVVNQPVTFSANVAVDTSNSGYIGTAVPAGTVTFTYGTSGQLCTATLSISSSTASCSASLPTVGSYAITATYNGDSTKPNFNPNFGSSSATAVVNQTVTKNPTTTTLVSVSSPTSVVNQTVTFSATVTPSDYGVGTGTALPSGPVTFTYGTLGQTLCTATLATSSPTASCQAAMPAAGSYAITATYNGDSTSPSFNPNFGSSSAKAAVNQTVTADPTITSAPTWSPSTALVNESVTFSTTVIIDTTNGFAGPTSPSGTVTFSFGPGQTACVTTLVAPATTASCPGLMPAAGSYTITSTYNGAGGNANFGQSTGSAAVSVSKATPTGSVSTTGGTSPQLNQSLNYSAVLNFGSCATAPTGTVQLSGDSYSTAQCTITLTPANCTGGVVTPSCSISFSTTGQHSVSAVYSGDNNFIGTTVYSPQISVQKALSTVSIVSSPTTSIATQPVTFTAIVGPNSGTPQPSGTVSFLFPSGQSACNPVSLPSTSPLTCTVQLPDSAVGQFSVTANYSGDNNFLSSTNTVTQTVQNFGLAFSSLTANLTQGYSTATGSSPGSDPFFPTSITVTETPQFGFADPLNVSCAVINSSTGASVTDPSCAISVTSLGGSGGSTLTFSLSASPTAAVGSYSVSLTATDSTLQTLMQTATMQLNVVDVASPMILVQGLSGTETVSFATSIAPSQLSFTCGEVKYFNTTNNSWTITTDFSQTPICSFNSGGAISVGNIATAPISISSLLAINNTQVRRRNSVYMAGLLGIPLFLLIGWSGRGKSTQKNFFRFFGMVLLLIGLAATNGCAGGGFTRPPPPPNNVMDAGSYLVQVVATDNNNSANKFFAVVPLTVNKN